VRSALWRASPDDVHIAGRTMKPECIFILRDATKRSLLRMRSG
jgi:hypothetical protein